MHWSEVWHGTSPGSHLARIALTPLSWLYAGAWECYLAAYRLGIKKAHEPHRPVLCIGNLVAGGTGKSPVCLYIARTLREAGLEVVVSCSGYGSPKSEEASIAPGGELNAAEWGDEPSMMRWLAPDLKLIVGRNRVRAAELCHDKFPGAVLLLDDGFQHLPLKKHLNLLLDPLSNNRRCLPAGPYREPWRHRSRADLCIPNGFRVSARIGALSTPDGAVALLAAGAKVNVLCALGNPSRFLEDVSDLGLRIEHSKTLPDHATLQVGNLFESLNHELPVIVTAKDWVKLRQRNDLGSRQILIASQEARIDPEAEFIDWLKRKLNELSNE